MIVEGKMVKYQAVCDALREIKKSEVMDGKS
jgi:hypothetical protein